MAKIIYSQFLPIKGFRAINLFGIIVARKEYGNLPEQIIRHEVIHSRQIRELWIVGFYVWYLTEWIINWVRYRDPYLAYRRISFELEAYTFDQDANYLKKRSRYAFRHFLRKKKF